MEASGLINSLKPQTKRHTALLASLVLATAACSADYDGGGIIAEHCIRQRTDLEMKKGDKVYVGVGDITIHTDTGSGVVKDALTLEAGEGRVTVKFPGIEDEHSVVLPGTEPSQQAFDAEENGTNLHIRVQPQGEVLVVRLDKTCPGQ